MLNIKVGSPTTLLAVFCATVAGGIFISTTAFSATGFEEIWFSEKQCDSMPNMEITMTHPETASVEEALSFQVDLIAAIPYQSVRIALIIENSEQMPVHHAALEADMHRGRNQLNFEWCGSEIPPGQYLIRVEVNFCDSFPPATCMVPLSKVSAAQWEQELAETDVLLIEMESIFADPSIQPANSLLTSQFLVAKAAALNARSALDDRNWRKLSHLVDYLENACRSLHAGIVFNSNFEGTRSTPDMPSLEDIQIRDGGFYVSDKPVFLFGMELNKDASVESQLEHVHQFGLNFAVATIAANELPDTITSTVENLVESAKAQSVALAIQFDQEAISGDIMDQWPELLEPGFTNLAHENFSNLYAERLAALALSLSGKPMIVAASIARTPQFQFDGESVRQLFIEHIQKRYPDRIELNRLWRSHLAEYEEITLWGDNPEHSYQNRRAYQYEWQSFQRDLITHFLGKIDQQLAEVAPDLPIMVTLPNSAFLTGETRNGVNREATAGMMDINGCMATSAPANALYAMNYPLPHVYYTLMRSYAMNKPILNLKGNIDLSALDSSETRYALVQSTLWEAVMTGANGMALSENNEVVDYPEAMEAFVTAAQDINRLAPIVTAFQQAPTQIGILFSEASKIMDDGVPHLESAQFAYEGASFSGYTLRFLTESQIVEGALEDIKVLILPDTLSVSDETFKHLSNYVDEGGTIARVGKPIPYNERGLSRSDVIRSTASTVLVRGLNLPTEYLHAMDAAQESGLLPDIARPINAFGYPLEGVRSRYIEHDNEIYLYIINLRKTPVNCYLTGVSDSGMDLIRGRAVDFPRVLFPLEPMMIRMNKRKLETALVHN